MYIDNLTYKKLNNLIDEITDEPNYLHLIINIWDISFNIGDNITDVGLPYTRIEIILTLLFDNTIIIKKEIINPKSLSEIKKEIKSVFDSIINGFNSYE